MQNAGDSYSGGHNAIKHDMFFMFESPQARTDEVASSADSGIPGEHPHGLSERCHVSQCLRFSPSDMGVEDDAAHVGCCVVG